MCIETESSNIHYENTFDNECCELSRHCCLKIDLWQSFSSRWLRSCKTHARTHSSPLTLLSQKSSKARSSLRKCELASQHSSPWHTSFQSMYAACRISRSSADFIGLNHNTIRRTLCLYRYNRPDMFDRPRILCMSNWCVAYHGRCATLT